MGVGLALLNRLAGVKALDRFGLRAPVQRTVFQATKTGFRTLGAASRTFGAVSRRPVRRGWRGPPRRALFDLTPTDEQRLIQQAAREFARRAVASGRLRSRQQLPAAGRPARTGDRRTRHQLRGRPGKLGGAGTERSAITGVLIAEALAHGDLGLAVALLAPAAVSTALVLWGDEEQQAVYLPSFLADDAPAAALAVLEPRPLFDPFVLRTTARPAATATCWTASNRWCRRCARRAVRDRRRVSRRGPGPVPGRGRLAGLIVEAEPAMGLRAATMARLRAGRGHRRRRTAGGDRAGRAAACGLHPAEPAGLGGAGGRHRAGRPGLRHPLRQRAGGVRRADQQPAVGGVHGRRHRHRARRHAAGDLPRREPGRAGPPFAREAVLARTLTAEYGMQIGSNGVQLLGGHGFVKEHPVERWYRDLRAAGVMEGAVSRTDAINLEVPAKFRTLINQSHQVAVEVLRANSRKYDLAEHEYPTELDMLAALVDGLNASGSGGTGATGVRRTESNDDGGTRNGTNLSTVLSILEASWGDVALVLSMPRQGLGNAAIASVANDEQHERFAGVWAAMAITEPGCGSDSAAIRTTAVRDGDDYLINGEKIYVTAGQRADAVVVWASLDKSQGRAAIKSFVVEKGTPGHGGRAAGAQARHPGLGHRDHPVHRLPGAGRQPARQRRTSMPTRASPAPCRPSTTPARWSPRWRSACAKAALDETRQILRRGRRRARLRPAGADPVGRGRDLPAAGGGLGGGLPDHAGGRLAGRQQQAELAACLDGQGQGRPVRRPRSRCAASSWPARSATPSGLLEKWARDSKILDIFEGTQQIQQLIVARRLLGKSRPS